jgi:catalase
VHFAKSLDQMLAFLAARARRGWQAGRGEGQGFLGDQLETLNQAHFVAGKPLPGSFVGVTYWGVHALPATNAHGRTRYIKF